MSLVALRLLIDRAVARCDASFTRFEMGATLPGVRLYERRGYLAVENMTTMLPDGEGLPVVRMVKDDATTSTR